MMSFHRTGTGAVLHRSGAVAPTAAGAEPAEARVEPQAPDTSPLSRLRGRWVLGSSGRPEMRWDVAGDPQD